MLSTSVAGAVATPREPSPGILLLSVEIANYAVLNVERRHGVLAISLEEKR